MSSQHILLAENLPYLRTRVQDDHFVLMDSSQVRDRLRALLLWNWHYFSSLILKISRLIETQTQCISKAFIFFIEISSTSSDILLLEMVVLNN